MAPTYKNFIYMEEQGFLFAYVPKVACTNWKSLLRYMAGAEDWLNNNRAHDKVNAGLRYLDPADAADMALLQDRSLRKYAMVRDPYSRTLSAYLNKVESRLPVQPESEGENHFCKVVRDIDHFRQEQLDTSLYPEITFEVFLLWLRDSTSPYTQDEHWAPQSSLLLQPDLEFDYIGRFEDLQTESQHLLQAMGCDQSFPSQKEVKFAPTGAQSKIDTYYSQPTYRLVNQIFARDFKNLSYNVFTECAVKVKERRPSKTHSLQIIKEIGIPLATVIDVGAQVKTEELAQIFPGKTHLLVEPIEEYLEDLESYYKESGINTKIAAVAAAEYDGEAQLALRSVNNGRSITHARLIDGPGMRTTPVRKVDTLVKEYDLPGPFLIKIDVDGAEERVLQGASATLQNTNVVIVEAQVRNFLDRAQPLIAAGFELMDLVDLCYYNNRLSQFDMIFVNKQRMIHAGMDLMGKTFDPKLWFKIK